jgi:hypothetical protein
MQDGTVEPSHTDLVYRFTIESMSGDTWHVRILSSSFHINTRNVTSILRSRM